MKCAADAQTLFEQKAGPDLVPSPGTLFANRYWIELAAACLAFSGEAGAESWGMGLASVARDAQDLLFDVAQELLPARP